jgi:hypothetical protein
MTPFGYSDQLRVTYPFHFVKSIFTQCLKSGLLMELLLTIVSALLIFLWVISRKSLFNPLYLAFFGYHAFRSLDRKEKLLTAHLVLEFCELYIGKSKKKPNLDLVNTTKNMHLGKIAGQYVVKTMTIKINDKYARSLFSLVRIILHEYAHHMQFMAFAKEDYQRILDDPNIQYSNHPWEKQARRMERDFWKTCIEFVLSRLGYIDFEDVKKSN